MSSPDHLRSRLKCIFADKRVLDQIMVAYKAALCSSSHCSSSCMQGIRSFSPFPDHPSSVNLPLCFPEKLDAQEHVWCKKKRPDWLRRPLLVLVDLGSSGMHAAVCLILVVQRASPACRTILPFVFSSPMICCSFLCIEASARMSLSQLS